MNQKTDHIVAKEIKAVLAERDGATIMLQFDAAILELPAEQAHRLMRQLLAVVTILPSEKPPPIGTEKAFPITRAEIGPGFPDGVGLNLRTAAFGRQGFVMDTDTAKRIAADLRSCAEQVEADRPTPGPKQ